MDIIHTDIAYFGIPYAIGHVDFYPNGGKNNPGCFANNTKVYLIRCTFCLFFKNIFTLQGVDKALVACDHSRSHKYFLEGISGDKCKMVSYYCGDYEQFLKVISESNNIITTNKL